MFIRIFFTLVFIFTFFNSCLFSATRYWVASSNSNWNNSANWSTAPGGAGGATVPGNADFVFFDDNASGDCFFDIPVTINGINTTNYNGTINLNGFSFQPVDSGVEDCIFGGGSIVNSSGLAIINYTTTGITVFESSTIFVELDFTSSRIYFNGATFYGRIDAKQDGTIDAIGEGGNSFFGKTTITNSGSGYIVLGNLNPDVFNGELNLNNTGTSILGIANNSAGNLINGNIIVSSTGGQGIQIGLGAGEATLANGKTITTGANGFTKGELKLSGFKQLGNTAQSITLNNQAKLDLSGGTLFEAEFSAFSPRIHVQQSTFNKVTKLEKTGNLDDFSLGNNLFKDTIYVINSGPGVFSLGTNNPDEFQKDLKLLNMGTGEIQLAKSSIGNLVSGDLLIYSTGLSRVINICDENNSSLDINGNVDIVSASIGPDSQFFIGHSGELSIGGRLDFSQNATGDTSIVYIAYESNAEVEITGVSNFTNSGGLQNRRLYLGNKGDVTFNDSLIISNNASSLYSEVYLNHRLESNNTYNGNILVSNTTIDSDGIFFGFQNGKGTLAAGKKITIGNQGFIAGVLYFRNLEQIGTTPQSLVLSGAAQLVNYSSKWGGNFNGKAQSLSTRGTIYSGKSILEKTGSAIDISYGGNVFKDSTFLIHSGSQVFEMGNTVADTFETVLDLKNVGQGNLIIASNSPNNYIGGNLIIESNGSGFGVINTVVGDGNLSSIQIDGDVVAENIGDANSNNLSIGSQGDVVIGGDLTIDHTPEGNNGNLFVARYINSTVEINGITTINQGASGGANKKSSFAESGDITFNNDLVLINNSTASQNSMNFAKNISANAYFNGDITFESPGFLGNGFYFGENGGVSEMGDGYSVALGSNGFLSGDLLFRNFKQIGSTPQSLLLSGTVYLLIDDSDWGGNVNFESARINTQNSRYRGTALLHKTSNVLDDCAGGNYFEKNTELKNSGIASFNMGASVADTFALNLIMRNESSASLNIAQNSINNYIGGDVSVFNHTVPGLNGSVGIASFSMATIEIDGSLSIDNIGNSTTSNVNFSSQGKTLLNGDLTINHSPVGTNGLLNITIGTGSTLIVNGETNISLNALGGSNKRTIISRLGTTVFNNDFNISNNATATFNHVQLADYSTGNLTFNGDVTIESMNSNVNGFFFGELGGTTELTNGHTIKVGQNGFVAGDLFFKNFTQTGNTPQELTLTGTAFMTQETSDWGGNIELTSPGFITSNTLYQGTSLIEKTGSSVDISQGGNVFGQNSTIKNTSTGFFGMGSGNNDLWSADLTVLSEGNGNISIAQGSAGNVVSGDFEIISSSGGAGIQSVFISNATISTFEVGGNTNVVNNAISGNKSITLGQNGDINFLGNLTIFNSASSTIGGIVLASFSNSLVSIGGNTIVENSGIGGTEKNIILGKDGDVIFNGSLNLTNSSTASVAEIRLNDNPTSANEYNNNIVLNSPSATSNGIFFGLNDGSGVLANGFSVSLGSAGFIGRNLIFKNFTQQGTVAQTLDLSLGNTIFESNNSTWNGPVNFKSARMFTNYSIYNSTATLHKSGALNDASIGGNVFNGETVIQNSGSQTFIPSNTVGNDFNDKVTYFKDGSGSIRPTFNATSTYSDEIVINSNSIIRFGEGLNGLVKMDGNLAQSISVVGTTPMPEFRVLHVINPMEEVTLNTPIEIIDELVLESGNIISNSTDILNMSNGSVVSMVSDNSFVDGPVLKKGNQIFTFPVGKTGVYRPIEISAPISITAAFKAEYFPQDVVTTGISDIPVEAPIDHISNCEYWMLDREASTDPVDVKLYYRNVPSISCSGVSVPSELLVSRWDGTVWKNHGNGGNFGTAMDGAVVSAGTISNFSPFTIASTTSNNPLPIELISFEVQKQGTSALVNWITASELNNDFFDLERSTDGYNFETIAIVDGAGNSSTVIDYEYLDREPKIGINYYRLKQVDFNGDFTYSDIKSADFDAWSFVNIYPNPSSKGSAVNISSSEVISKIEITNEMGQFIFKSNYSNDENQIKLNNLNLVTGVYFVKVYSLSSFEVKKLIVR